MVSKQCDSAASLKYEIEAIRNALCQTETEDSWDKIARAITTMTTLAENGACEFEAELVSAIRSLYRPLISAINSERTKLSGAALDLISALASGLGPAFEPLLPLFFPTLLTLCTRTNKVFITRARACISTVIDSTQLPAVLTYFSQSIKDKAVSLRLAASEGVLACMNCFNPPDLEKEARAREVEAVIRATARDANADVRKTSRKIFEAYKILLPGRVDSFTEPLSPTMKKYLNIISKPSAQQNPIPRLKTSHQSHSDLKATANLSSSTSALNPQTSSHNPSLSDHTHTHGRSTSANAGDPTRPSGEGQTNGMVTRSRSKTDTAAVPVPGNANGAGAMAPPDYIPVRPVQPPKRTVPATRADSRHQPSTTATTSNPSSSHPSRFVPITGGGARRVNQVQPVPSVPATTVTVQAKRPQRPVAAKTTTDGLLRPVPDSKPSNPDAPLGSSGFTTGPRRVPISEVIRDDRPEPTRARRPISRNDNASVPVSRPGSSASTKSTNEAQKVPAASGKGKTAQLAVRTKACDPAKPSLRNQRRNPPNDADKPKPKTNASSSIAGGGTGTRIDAKSKGPVVERKPEVSKPAWGRLVPRQAPKVLKTAVTKEKVPELKKKASVERKEKPVPAEVPPPPNPTTPAPTPTPPPTETPPLTEEHQENAPIEIEEAKVENPPFVMPDVEKPKLITDPATYEATLAEVCHALQNPQRPKFGVSETGTPISALLSSIQQGFLFTPSSPLSPLDSYIPKPGVPLKEGVIPFPLDKLTEGGKHENMFIFGDPRKAAAAIAGEESNRLALSNVEVNTVG